MAAADSTGRLDAGKSDKSLSFKDKIKIGNPRSCIAICTLWTQKETILGKIPDSKYYICGNLYTSSGVNYLVKNILSHPQIRYLIVCGKEMNDSGTALVNFMTKGIDGNRKIIDSNAFIDSNIDPDLIEKLRTNVTLIDMRGKEGEVGKLIETLPRKEPFSDPVYVEEGKAEYPTITSENVFLIKGKTISESWLKILDMIMKFGETKPSEYGIKQKEVLDLTVVVEESEEKIASWLKLSDKDLESYFSKFFNSEKPEDISYTYGERLFKYPLKYMKEKWSGEITSTFNQIESIIEHLRKAPYTRRAIAFTWNMDVDSDSSSPPCLTQITWNINNGSLYQTAILRSNDMFGAWPMNAFALRKLQRNIANKLGVKCGPFVTISNSAHIYENNWKECREILDKYYTGGELNFEQDRLGYFTIRIDRDETCGGKNGSEIVVQHHLPDGRSSSFVFKGKTAAEIYRRILNENLVSRCDHAAYLGKELARAEAALKKNKEYEQE